MHCNGSFKYWFTAAAMFCCAPAIGQVDTSSPKSALKSFYAATQHADAAAIQQLIIVQNDPEQQLLGAYTDMILAGKRLADVAKDKFSNVPDAFAQGEILPEDSAHIDSAQVTTNGNTAQLKFSDRPTPITLQQTASGWRILVEEPTATPQHRAEQIALLAGLTDAFKKSADEIDADKYPTVEDAENAVKQRLGAVVAKSLSDSPTSKPTTRP